MCVQRVCKVCANGVRLVPEHEFSECSTQLHVALRLKNTVQFQSHNLVKLHFIAIVADAADF